MEIKTLRMGFEPTRQFKIDLIVWKSVTAEDAITELNCLKQT